jgi:hypothetical protein
MTNELSKPTIPSDPPKNRARSLSPMNIAQSPIKASNSFDEAQGNIKNSRTAPSPLPSEEKRRARSKPRNDETPEAFRTSTSTNRPTALDLTPITLYQQTATPTTAETTNTTPPANHQPSPIEVQTVLDSEANDESTEVATQSPSIQSHTTPTNQSAEANTATIPPPIKIKPPPFNMYCSPRKMIPGRELIPPKVSFKCALVKYYDLTVKSMEAEGEEMYENLFMQLEGLVKELFRADKTLKIFVYDECRRESDSTFIRSLDNYKEIMADRRMEVLTAYFEGAEPRGDGGKIHIKMLIGTEKTEKIITTQVGVWSKGGNHWFGERVLQLPDIVEVGWSLFSLPGTDLAAMAEATQAFCGFPVGLKYKTIDSDNDHNDKLRAIHFSVDQNFQNHDREILCKVFKANKVSGFPMGIISWFIPLHHTSKGVVGKNKMLRRRARQARFLAKIKDSFTITTHWPLLDDPSDKLEGLTLREALMDVRTKANREDHLFVGITKPWKRAGDKVTYTPNNKDEAVEVISNFLPYLRFYLRPTKRNQFDRLFTKEAVDKANRSRWNHQQYRCQDVLTDQLDEVDAEKPNAWEDLEEDEEIEEQPNVTIDRTDMEVVEAETTTQGDEVDTTYSPVTHIDMISLGPDNGESEPIQVPQVSIEAIAKRPIEKVGVRYAVGAPIPTNPIRKVRVNTTAHYEAGLLNQSAATQRPAPNEAQNGNPRAK